MNKKTLAVLILMGLSMSVKMCFASHCEEYNNKNTPELIEDENKRNARTAFLGELKAACDAEKAKAAKDKADTEANKRQKDLEGDENYFSIGTFSEPGDTLPQKCKRLDDGIKKYMADNPNGPKPPKHIDSFHCENLEAIAGDGFYAQVGSKDVVKKSTDGQINCYRKASYTIDVEECESAVKYYDIVKVSEQTFELQQTIRTDLTNREIQQEASARAANGDLQGGALDAGKKSHEHQEQMNREKIAAYSGAIAGLTVAYMKLPSEKKAVEVCKQKAQAERLSKNHVELCPQTVKLYKSDIIPNEGNKGTLAMAITTFTAKAAAAGIKLNQHDSAAKKIEEAKNNLEDGDDLMMEQCVFNPADPACIKGNRVSVGSGFGAGDFTFGGGDGTNNSFDMKKDGEAFGDLGAESKIDDSNEVASINSPFQDEAKDAKGILDPAAAAETQPTGGAGGGGSGGGGGGGGGGSASLGSDLDGADKDGNKEAQVKTQNVSGSYAYGGGGGYKGVGSRGGKAEDGNPFANLFGDKSEGGVEIDRTISSGDIDGKASGLFEKISKRYGQVHADKRIEAKNLE